MDNCAGLLCEIHSHSTNLVTTGIIEKVDESAFYKIKKNKYNFPLYKTHDEVQISIISKTNSSIYIGKIIVSSPDLIALYDVEKVSPNDKRNFFRIKVIIRTSFSLIENDNLSEKTNPCIIKDISLSGIRITTPVDMNIDDIFRINIPVLDDKTLSVDCVVRNKNLSHYSKNSNSHSYGCMIINKSNTETNLLQSYIFEIQQQRIMQLTKL